ncbi:MAG TPA: SWIM zinc finger family protein [Abditibacteriaceae bacterium]|jgi:uncharacterized Zn finger protein
MSHNEEHETEPLHEDAIEELAETKVFARGVDLFESGDALFGLHRQDTLLRGWCWGTASKLYRLHALVENGAVVHTLCDCPYAYGGICKHLVALLLAQCHTPEVFQEIPPLEELLANLSPASLINIVSSAITRDPQLLAELAPAQFELPSEYFDRRDEDEW